MTVSLAELALYAGAMFIMVLTPGPVWLALAARTLSGGFGAAWPLALGVVIGDGLWPLLAILGVSWVVGQIEGFMLVLRLVGAVMFLFMGLALLRKPDRGITSDGRLTRPGRLAGFLAGLAAIAGNPKAILFYMGILPGFFDLTRVTGWDIAAVVGISMGVPLVGNLLLAGLVSRVRRLLTSGSAMRRTNIFAGCLMVCIGLVIPFA
ncbi:LysE family translocator [Pseudooceanicola sediminis]|mgnify:CR=1 FL=1|uniref:LysE family translocator n=1 Tax=Pseudooceanicola sediminis TaxID=2211117 RepID=A0A399J498_9RHOB|nr:LysE family translocator [Pseudooceanicola sediminis]KAA2315548.1 LysE family translocator [Puniceibacterium sp. HSS470]RII40248.1 LysE family translocator [Pseudooceanicola sediminis]|tara:strand:+ start:38683 stop:39303 length:621 start_codon:yes stop_codon:yes gene_type:complete